MTCLFGVLLLAVAICIIDVSGTDFDDPDVWLQTSTPNDFVAKFNLIMWSSQGMLLCLVISAICSSL